MFLNFSNPQALRQASGRRNRIRNRASMVLFWRKCFCRKSIPKSSKQQRRVALESLEPRWLPSTFFSLDPAATYLHTDGTDYPASDLLVIPVQAGDSLRI